MYCSKCNASLKGNENYCSYCGNKINPSFNDYEVLNNENKSIENRRTASIALGIISLCGIFFVVFSPISLILSIIGLFLAIKSSKNVKNTPGIILNAVSIFISFIITLFIVLAILFTFNIIKDIDIDEYIPNTQESELYGDF